MLRSLPVLYSRRNGRGPRPILTRISVFTFILTTPPSPATAKLAYGAGALLEVRMKGVLDEIWR